MGDGVLLWEQERPAPSRLLRPPVPALTLDPSLSLLDRVGNLGMLRLLAQSQAAGGSAGAGTATTAGTPAPTSSTATPAPATSTPAEDVAPPQLALANPYTSTYALSTDYALTSHLLGWGFNPLVRALGKDPFPSAGRFGRWALAPLTRALLSLPVVLPEIAGMTYSHEMGHFRADVEAGGSPKITFPRDAWYAIWTGVTDPNYAQSYPAGSPELLRSQAAGVNQEQLNADYLFWDAARRGGGFSEASAYFLGRTNTFFYSALLPLIKGITNIDDINQYRRDLKAAGRGDLSRGAISWGSGLTAALSSGTLGSFVSLGRYLALGESRFDIPTSRIGGFEFTWPDFHYLLTTAGPLVGGQSLLFPKSKTPFGATLDVRPGTSGVALGGRLFDMGRGDWLRFPDWLRVSPFAAASVDEDLGGGFRLGADVRVRLPYGFQIIATPSYSYNYLLDEPTGTGGPRFNASLGLPIP